MEEYITQKGLNQLKEELKELKTQKKWEIANWLKEAAQQGDMAENAEYIAAKEAQTALEARIEELENKIRNAKVVRKKQGEATVGATVELIASGNKKHKVQLVSSEESDASGGKISISSPMGNALMGKQEGEDVEVVTPKGKKRYRIVKIA